MNAEIELVHEFMNDVEDSTQELRRAHAMLDEAIAADLEASIPIRDPSGRAKRGRPRKKSRSLLRWSIAGTAAAAAVGAILFQVVPSSKTTTPEAAAAEIARLAEAVQPPPPLLPGQWYQYRLQGVASAHVSTSGSTVTASSTASIPVAIGEWSNSSGAVCTSQQFGTATFASPTDAQAWQAMGLVDTPADQPATGCSAGVDAALEGGGGSPSAPIDVSHITHDPGTLADQLQQQTTGIPSIDDYAAKGYPPNVAGFQRLTVLLVGPVKGQWSGFGQEVLQTMARLPGVVALGAMTSHAGASGLAFSTHPAVTLDPATGAEISSFSPPTVLLDAQSGALLEVRNLDFPLLQSAAQDFVGSASAPVYTQGVGYSVTMQWIDPLATLGVVAPSLPSWIDTIHIIEAVTEPSTSQAQISAVVNPLLGNGNMASSDDNTPVSGESTYDITVVGTAGDEQTVLSALTASGLFSSLAVKLS